MVSSNLRHVYAFCQGITVNFNIHSLTFQTCDYPLADLINILQISLC